MSAASSSVSSSPSATFTPPSGLQIPSHSSDHVNPEKSLYARCTQLALALRDKKVELQSKQQEVEAGQKTSAEHIGQLNQALRDKASLLGRINGLEQALQSICTASKTDWIFPKTLLKQAVELLAQPLSSENQILMQQIDELQKQITTLVTQAASAPAQMRTPVYSYVLQTNIQVDKNAFTLCFDRVSTVWKTSEANALKVAKWKTGDVFEIVVSKRFLPFLSGRIYSISNKSTKESVEATSTAYYPDTLVTAIKVQQITNSHIYLDNGTVWYIPDLKERWDSHHCPIDIGNSFPGRLILVEISKGYRRRWEYGDAVVFAKGDTLPVLFNINRTDSIPVERIV